MEEDPDPLFYHVFGLYHQAAYWYEPEAEVNVNSEYGWCDYSAPSCAGRLHGEPIANEYGLQLMLAFMRNGTYLEPGALNQDNKLNGEGPFRVVPPQKMPGPPDQSSKYDGDSQPVWPFDASADHNAGYATRSATMIRVDPLPEGTTDIDTLEAGWEYVDEGKIIIYGAVDPLPTIEQKIEALYQTIAAAGCDSFKHRILKWVAIFKIKRLQRWIDRNRYQVALTRLDRTILTRVDGCVQTGLPDNNDWVTDCEFQNRIYWAIHEISVLLKIIT